MPKTAQNDFLKQSLLETPRLLGQLNRNPSSKNYGSFDRAFWHYRTNDISCCRYQEAVYTLTLLYCHDFEGNKYHKDPKILEWIRAGLTFTTSIQRKDGSFDEWYINEGSYVGTAFVVAALSQALLLLRKENVSIPEESICIEMVLRGAKFLMARSETTVLNQVSGAIFAIAAAGTLADRSELKEFSKKLLEIFLKLQSKEGWWSEYGGPDIGYLSLTISYLEKYMDLEGKNDATAEALERAKSFVLEFVHPDKTAGGEYMARNTEYLIPSAALPYLGSVGPAQLDDRYLSYILYNWIETGLQTEPQSLEILPGDSYFSESTLLKVANEKYFFVANGKKGGAFRIYANGKVYYDSGIEMRAQKELLTTGTLDEQNKVTFEKNIFTISGSLKPIQEPLLATRIMILFKSFQFIFGRFPWIQKLLKSYLRKRMISYKTKTAYSFKRRIAYSENDVIITDLISGESVPDDILYGTKAAYTAVPSSKYVGEPELAGALLLPRVETEKTNEGTALKRTFSFS